MKAEGTAPHSQDSPIIQSARSSSLKRSLFLFGFVDFHVSLHSQWAIRNILSNELCSNKLYIYRITSWSRFIFQLDNYTLSAVFWTVYNFSSIHNLTLHYNFILVRNPRFIKPILWLPAVCVLVNFLQLTRRQGNAIESTLRSAKFTYMNHTNSIINYSWV